MNIISVLLILSERIELITVSYFVSVCFEYFIDRCLFSKVMGLSIGKIFYIKYGKFYMFMSKFIV